LYIGDGRRASRLFFRANERDARDQQSNDQQHGSHAYAPEVAEADTSTIIAALLALSHVQVVAIVQP
jgi:hypothetical protein